MNRVSNRTREIEHSKRDGRLLFERLRLYRKEVKRINERIKSSYKKENKVKKILRERTYREEESSIQQTKQT